MSVVSAPFRKTLFTTVFFVSEIFLLTAPLMLGAGPLGVLWRILLIPAYVLIALMSLIVPWTAHVPIVATALLLLLGLDALLLWQPRTGPEDLAAPE